MKVLCSELVSPVGRLLLAEGGDGGVLRIEFAQTGLGKREFQARVQKAVRIPIEVAWAKARRAKLQRQLQEYFAGKRRAFDLELTVIGTPFQIKVWEHLCEIPYGETRSYAQLARSIGQPTAVRAVARANGQNPISIVVPCHRVIGSDGSLTGYGGGLPRKQKLLALEAGVAGTPGTLPFAGAS